MTKYFLTTLMVVFYFNASAQSNPEKIVAALDSFAFIQPQEKTYVQTDRSTYLSGESIWYKAYTTLNEKPTILSKILYVELISQDGQLVDKKMLKLINGIANGNFDTKSTYASGNYLLRAYTLWMLNFPEFIFEKKISILNASESKITTPPPYLLQDVSVVFYPEGGNLVSTIKSIVALKATDQNNNPVEVKGTILNGKNETVASFETVHNGMGKFEFVPKEGEIYKAQIISTSGQQKNFQLPQTNIEGIVLRVDNNTLSKTFVSVSRNEKNKALYNNLILVAQINYQVVYIGKLNIDDGLDAVAIPKKNLPAGIMQISILKEDGTPIAERLVFIANHTIDKETIKATNINTEKRQRNSIIIDVSHFKNLNAAIAITNASATITVANDNILASFLLSSDIKGTVHHAEKYFENKESTTLRNLDFVMLTNGWRRYKLEDIVAKKYAALKYPFERGLTVTGKVLESNGKSILKAGKINLIINGEDSTKIMSQANTNTLSAFYIDNIDYKKEATIFYQGTNLNNKNAIVSVNINSSFFDTLKNSTRNIKEPFFSMETTISSNYYDNLILEKQLKESEKSKTLETVVVKSKKSTEQETLNKLYASEIFYESDQTIAVNTEVNTGDILQFLRGVVSGISIIRSDTGTQVNFTRYQGADYFSENGATGVQFFLNEVPVTIDVVESLFAEDIGLVKVYKGNMANILGASRGAIALYTVKGKSSRDWRKKGFDFVKKLGYSVEREFGVIDYTKINPLNDNLDKRTTIYWNPNLVVKDGKAIVNFYNDDVCKKFKIIVEGIDENGLLLHAEKEIE